MSLVTDLTGEIRGAAAPERSRGHTAQSTAGVSQAPAVTQPNAVPAPGAQADFPVEGAGGPARRDQANHFGWRLQAGMEIRSYAETIAVRDAGAGAAVVVDPAIATIWRITAAGALTLSVSDIPAGTVGGVPAQRVHSIVLMIHRVAGGTIAWPPGTMWGADVRDPNGDGSETLLGPASAARLDIFVLQRVPSVGWIGSVAAIDVRSV